MESNKMKKISLLSFLLFSIVFISGCSNDDGHSHEEPSFHIHTDFKVYINEKFLNFSDDKYQTDIDSPHSTVLHLHDNDGEVIHFHEEGHTIVDFFETIGFKLTNNCITTDNDKEYCSDDSNSFKVFVNGVEKENIENYYPEDLDRILIYYGDNSEDTNKLITKVTDKACIQSEKCPERGLPTDSDSCGGTSCEFVIE